MEVRALRTRVFKEDEDLGAFIIEHIPTLQSGSILVVTSKIVSLSEGRTADVKDREKIIQAESEFVMRTKHTWLTIKDGTVMASAGVDESNADGKLILLPKDSFQSADALRTKFLRHFNIQHLGILITDSRFVPLRAGAAGVALGYAGFKGVREYRGKPDIFGRVLRLSRTDIADGLATAAVLEMGEGAEKQPLAIIESAPVEFVEKVDRHELHIDIDDDLYRPLFENLPEQK